VANPHSGGAYLNPTSSNAGQKAGELHRACSIPAIIVGEIPKLIVTSSSEAPPLKTAPNVQQQRFGKNILIDENDNSKSLDSK
jgi:hypothetical protein